MAPLITYLRRLVLFGVFCALAYPVLLVGIGALLRFTYVENLRYPLGDYGHMYTRLKEVKDHGPVDVVFLGSSHAYRGFDPRIWAERGFTSFNLGSSSQTPLQTELIARRYLPALDPRLVILEVYPGTFRSNGAESAVDLIANGPMDGATVRMALRTKNAMVFNTLLYGSMRRTLGLDANYQEDPVKVYDRYVPHGYVERIEGNFTPNDDLLPELTEPFPRQVEAFDRLLGFLRESGYPVVLVETPMTRWMYTGLYTDHDTFAARMDSLAPYVDMNGKVDLDDGSHFFTMDHMNQAGVVRFDKVLLDTMEQRGWLPEAR
jgi:hypothetical protein